MAENSKIEWTTHSFSPWLGCQEVSPACDGCYAREWARRFKTVEWGPHADRKRTTTAYWRQPYSWARKAKANGTRPQVFSAHYADVFDNQVPPEWRADLWDLIRATPQLDWLLLTKRPENIRKMLPVDWGSGWPHVWLGCTTEDQHHFDRRWPIIATIPAVVRFLSYEPALGPLVLGDARPSWVICGGESSQGKHKARHMPLEWARALRDECAAAGVAFFFKQTTNKGPIPDDLMVRQYPTPCIEGRAAA